MNASPRSSAHPIEPLFLNRWSPRAFAPSAMPTADLMTILEAARWAPSAHNIQPWRFLYAQRGDAHWQTYLSLMNEFNAGWAQNASAIVIVMSDTLVSGVSGEDAKPSHYHSFDAGAAWAQLALQATSLEYQAHATAGLDTEQAHETLAVPKRYRIEIAVAIGKRCDPSMLPVELQEREIPSQRLDLKDIAFAGSFAP